MVELWQIWLIAAGVFFIMEIMTVGFLVFWLGIGALAAMVVSLFTGNIIIQTSVFVVVSTLLMFSTRPLVKKFVKQKDVTTNANSIIGKTGLVTSDINPMEGTGQVKIFGEIWSAKSEDTKIIEKGSDVTIVKIEGVKAIVKK